MAGGPGGGGDHDREDDKEENNGRLREVLRLVDKISRRK